MKHVIPVATAVTGLVLLGIGVVWYDWIEPQDVLLHGVPDASFEFDGRPAGQGEVCLARILQGKHDVVRTTGSTTEHFTIDVWDQDVDMVPAAAAPIATLGDCR